MFISVFPARNAPRSPHSPSSSPSILPAPSPCLAYSGPPLKVIFSGSSPLMCKSCDSFSSGTFVDPPSLSILGVESLPAPLSGGVVDVCPATCVSYSLSKLPSSDVLSIWAWTEISLLGLGPNLNIFTATKAMDIYVSFEHRALISTVAEVVSSGLVGVYSSAFVRCLTAVCSPWGLVYLQIYYFLCDLDASSLWVVILGVHVYVFLFDYAVSPPYAALSLVQIQICFLTFVRCRLSLILVLSSILNFAFWRFITAVCRLLVVLNPALGAVSLVSFLWWQVERKLCDKSPPVFLVMSGIWCPVISFTESCFFPKFPPKWSGLDVQASPVLQGSSSWLMAFSAFVAVYVTSRVAVDAVIQEAFEIVVFRFLMVSFHELYRQFISSLTIFWCFFRHSLLCFHVLLFPPLVLEFEAL